MWSRLMALAPMVIGAACGGGHGVSVEHSPLPEPPDSVLVQVVNDNFYDARIHAVWDGGQRVSLGTVAGNGNRAEASIRWEPRPIVFEILFIIGGTAYVSHPVEVERGDIIEVRLPRNIDMSGFFRRLPRQERRPT